MRTIAVLAMLCWSATVAAQSPRPIVTQRSAGIPLSRSAIPLPPLSSPPPSDPRPGYWAPTLGLPVPTGSPVVTRAPRNGGYRHGRFGWDYVPPAAVWAVPAYGFGYLPQVWASPAPDDWSYAFSERRDEGPSTGFLRLEVQPEGLAQLYVDGYYVGRPSDFNRDVEVEAGAHTIEIRAPGHETLQFDVNVSPRGWISYRGALKPVSAPPPPGPSVRTRQNAVPQQPTTFYVIPGCYAGNVPPKDAGLPATCDQRQVMKFRP